MFGKVNHTCIHWLVLRGLTPQTHDNNSEEWEDDVIVVFSVGLLVCLSARMSVCTSFAFERRNVGNLARYEKHEVGH